MFLVQLYEIKIKFGAVGAFVVELVHSHVLLLDFYCAIVEWVSGVLASGDGDDHIWCQHRIVHSFDTLWRYTKYSAHRLLVISIDCKYKDSY